jgi:hypothetical protein
VTRKWFEPCLPANDGPTERPKAFKITNAGRPTRFTTAWGPRQWAILLVRLRGSRFGGVGSRCGPASAALGFGFGGEQGPEDDAIGIDIELDGFGNGKKKIDRADPLVARSDEACARRGSGIRRIEPCFFVFERPEFLTKLDPFVDELAEQVRSGFGSDEDLVDLGADFRRKTSGELSGLSGFRPVGLLDAGETVGNEVVAQSEERCAIGGPKERGGGGKMPMDTTNDVVVSIVRVGLFFDDLKKPRIEGAGLTASNEVLVRGLEARNGRRKVARGENGFVRGRLGIEPFTREVNHFGGGQSFSGHGKTCTWGKLAMERVG